jgi:hypothetical protein
MPDFAGPRAIPATESAKRTGGRPIKAARKGRRYRISVDISGPTKALIAARIKNSGRTLAREAEIMIQGFVQYENVLSTEPDKVHQMLRLRGYYRLPISNPRTGQCGFAWAEPGLIEESGFVPYTEEELQARRAEEEPK